MMAHVCRRRVAPEAGWRLFLRNFAAQSVLHRIRNSGWVVRRNCKSQITKKTDTRFLKVPVVLKQEALSAAAASEHPQNRGRKSFPLSSHQVGHGVVLFGQAVVEGANVIGRVAARDLRFRGRSSAVCHCVLLLAGSERSMALGADLGAHVVAAGGISFTWPPARIGQMFIAGELFAYGCRHLRRRHRHEKEYRKQSENLRHKPARREVDDNSMRLLLAAVKN